MNKHEPNANQAEILKDGPMRKPGQKLARPRNAATLLIVRRDGPKPRLLMGRRHGGHDFMPDKWVFPGGRIDRSDYKAPFATDLRPDIHARLEKSTPRNMARALALTAIRETFEEVGLLLARPVDNPRPGIGPWREFLEHGAEPDLGCLDFIAQAITPHYRPKRFNARFFMAPAENLVSLERLPDCGELDEIAWFEIDEALQLDLPGITRFVLEDLPERFEDPGRPAPFTRFIRGNRLLTHL